MSGKVPTQGERKSGDKHHAKEAPPAEFEITREPKRHTNPQTHKHFDTLRG